MVPKLILLFTEGGLNFQPSLKTLLFKAKIRLRTDLIEVLREVDDADVEDDVPGADDERRPVAPEQLEVVAVTRVPGKPLNEL